MSAHRRIADTDLPGKETRPSVDLPLVGIGNSGGVEDCDSNRARISNGAVWNTLSEVRELSEAGASPRTQRVREVAIALPYGSRPESCRRPILFVGEPTCFQMQRAPTSGSGGSPLQLLCLHQIREESQFLITRLKSSERSTWDQWPHWLKIWASAWGTTLRMSQVR